MRYNVDNDVYQITLNKDEMITLISLLSEGLENLKKKMESDTLISSSKYSMGKKFVDDLDNQIMRW